MKTDLIILCGKKEAGKTTSARIFATFFKESCIYSFASPLKEVAGIFGISRFDCAENKNALTTWSWNDLEPSLKDLYPFKKGNLTVREFLQVFGTDVVRNCFSRNAWVKLTYDAIESLKRDTPAGHHIVYIIDDARFANEIALRHGLKSVIIKVNRPSLVTSGDSHVSETSLDSDIQWNYVINNDSSIESLEQKIQEIVNALT